MRQPALNQDIFIIVRQNRPQRLGQTRSERKQWPLWYAELPSVFTSYDEAYNAVKRQRRKESSLLSLSDDFNIIRVPKD